MNFARDVVVAADPRRLALVALTRDGERREIEFGEVSDRAGRHAGTLSQRLGIGAALLGDPPVLLFDEPINGLDPEGILWLRRFLRDLADDGRTVFLSSHLMGEMAQTADHLIVIGQGRLIADAPTTDILRTHARSSVRVRALERQEELSARLLACGVQLFELRPASTLPAGRSAGERSPTSELGR